jgi:uncharacterized protein YoxC
MAFATEDWLDLVRLLEQHPEWRAELRRLVLSEEVLNLPQTVSELAGAQRNTGQGLEQLTVRVDALAQQLKALTERVDALAQQLMALSARVDALAQQLKALTERVDALAARLEGLAQRVEELVQAQRHSEESIRQLAEFTHAGFEQLRGAQAKMESRLARLQGAELERRYRERAASYFQTILRRIRVLDHQALGLMLDDAVESGSITPAEKADILLLDVVVQGRRNGEEVYLAAEVSAVVGEGGVERAASRAQLLSKATGKPVIAVAAGEQLLGSAAEAAGARGVLCVVDGRAIA